MKVQKQSRMERMKIAARIVKLSDQVLSTKENRRYIALQVGSPPYCNAVIVSDSDYVKFLISSTDLLNRVKAEGFAPEKRNWQGFFRGGYRFLGLGVSDIEIHEGLFRDVIKESIEEIKQRRGTKK